MEIFENNVSNAIIRRESLEAIRGEGRQRQLVAADHDGKLVARAAERKDKLTPCDSETWHGG